MLEAKSSSPAAGSEVAGPQPKYEWLKPTPHADNPP
jgi:hypothetical protein